jgi:maleylpyruvate isomerase
MTHDRIRVQRWLDAETPHLLETVQALRNSDLTAPSTLLDWSTGHLLVHLARNADALCNLLHWARTGIETPMYQSVTSRVDDINRGALRATDVIVDDVVTSAVTFSERVAELDESDWLATVRTAQGRTVPAADVLWLRLREVTMHHVDLGASIDDLPVALIDELLADVAQYLRATPTWSPIDLKASDSTFDSPDPQASALLVTGTSGQLLGWLTGRTDGAGLVTPRETLPALPNWL